MLIVEENRSHRLTSRRRWSGRAYTSVDAPSGWSR